MSRLIHVIVVTDGHHNKVDVAHSMEKAIKWAENYYRLHPRRFNRYVQLVDTSNGEVTTL